MKTRNCAALALRLSLVAALPTAILGCGQSGPAQVKPELAPIVVDSARYRCPDVEPRVEQVFHEQFVPPPASRPLPDGSTGLDEQALKVWVDRAEEQHQRTTSAGRSVTNDYKRCKDGHAAADQRVARR
jgi:hypothetical protein